VVEVLGLDFPTPYMAATLAVGRLSAAPFSLPELETMKTIHPDPPYEKPTPHPDNRFMALTGNCTDMPTLFVDTHAPLDILMDAANYRIRAVTQVLENLSMRGSIECESFILSDFSLLCAIPLRDGCDVLDVVGRRLRAR
jgi:hypothetical protein